MKDDIMSISEQEKAQLFQANGDHDRCEAASGTKGADHGIISVSKQEEAWLIQRTRGKAT